MTQFEAAKTRYTQAEFLAMEDKADHKHEYYDGEIRARTGASYNHNVIAANLAGLFYNAFAQSDCQALISHIKVRVEAANLFTYPDVVIVGGEPEFYQERTDIITNPVVIFEILAASTKKRDMTDKLEQYASIKSVLNYILIDQQRMVLRNYQRLEAGKWLTELLNDPLSVLKLPAVATELKLAQIYQRVRLKQK